MIRNQRLFECPRLPSMVCSAGLSQAGVGECPDRPMDIDAQVRQYRAHYFRRRSSKAVEVGQRIALKAFASRSLCHSLRSARQIDGFTVWAAVGTVIPGDYTTLTAWCRSGWKNKRNISSRSVRGR